MSATELADRIDGLPGGTIFTVALKKQDRDLIVTALRAIPSQQGDEGAASSADHHQKRGAAWDIVDEALNTYDEWMLDDDYEFNTILKKIMNRMRERRALYPPAPEGEGTNISRERDARWAADGIEHLRPATPSPAGVEDDSDAFVLVPRASLEWWKQLADINPKDLPPRIDRVLAATPAPQPAEGQPSPELERWADEQLREALRVIRDHAIWEDGESVEALHNIIEGARDVASEALSRTASAGRAE